MLGTSGILHTLKESNEKVLVDHLYPVNKSTKYWKYPTQPEVCSIFHDQIIDLQVEGEWDSLGYRSTHYLMRRQSYPNLRSSVMTTVIKFSYITLFEIMHVMHNGLFSFCFHNSLNLSFCLPLP